MKQHSNFWILVTALATLLLLACHGDSKNLRAEKFATLPDWGGVWISAEPIGDLGIDGYPADDFLQSWKMFGFTAPYNDSTQAKLGTLMSGVRQSSKTEAWGFPFMMESPTPIQFTITPEEIIILSFYRDIRHIYTDGRSLPPIDDRWPTPWGDSIGYWEGDTLVIKTASVERPGYVAALLLVSNDAEYTERLRKVNPDRIESELIITDPATLKHPWVIKLSYKRADGLDRMFHNRFDNDRTVLDEDGKTFTIADKPR